MVVGWSEELAKLSQAGSSSLLSLDALPSRPPSLPNEPRTTLCDPALSAPTTLPQRSANVTLVVPASGTSLWADLWTVPSGATGGNKESGPSPLLPLWLDYSLQPSRAAPSKGLTSGGASPLLLPGDDGDGLSMSCPELVEAPGRGPGRHTNMDEALMPAPEVLQRSEFLLPLDDATHELYSRLLRPAPPEDS